MPSNSKLSTQNFKLVFLMAALLLAGCGRAPIVGSIGVHPVPAGMQAQVQATATPPPGEAVLMVLVSVGTPTPAAEPPGCQRPPDDYTRVRVSGAQLNARTLAMLDHAQELYRAQGGYLDLRTAITQGSYTGGALAASFGTHDGGGAVDLSVRSPVDFSLPRDQIEPLVYALRVAGFAAWLRDTGDLYPASPIHIHAVAIGDREASEAARAQIDGTFGYLRGFDGIPRPDGIPQMDRHGGPVICQWMRELGFDDLRNLPYPTATPGGTANPIASGGSQ